MAWIPAAIIGGTSLVGMMLDDSGDDAKDVARIQAAKAYPGQKTVAKALAPYLWENVDTGLTEQEKTQYRSTGKTNILQQVRGTQKQTSNIFASQGLKGGRVADMLAGISESAFPEFARLESNIFGLDQAKKDKRMKDILDFLNLKAGEGEEAGGGYTPGSIESIVAGLLQGGGPGANYGGGTSTGNVGQVSTGFQQGIQGILDSMGYGTDISVSSSGVSSGPGGAGPGAGVAGGVGGSMGSAGAGGPSAGW